jgi:hypothetical protein
VDNLNPELAKGWRMSRAEMLAARMVLHHRGSSEGIAWPDGARGLAAKETRAERNVRWVEERCRIPEGKFVGQKLQMADFMVENFRAIYDNDVLTRRAIISRGRKNAKSSSYWVEVVLPPS